ncbi:endo-1,4-beta-xylanase [Ruania zhangjianzhongii]|uniref:endo-1,4-beta-xylanase n=1 Tax=Ruania zhangjianzhongii TaxID=2603206 RepID=UPI0011C982F5|nr:endo-1,4-beta-xylanase [Ruania zhangjianzhongii]
MTATATVLHRTGTADLTLTAPTGEPLADQDVRVEQTRHGFEFGNIGFDLVAHATGEEQQDRLAADWLRLFNTATLPFYWGTFEPERGRPDTARLRAAARWFGERRVRVKGHPLVWHTVKAPWLDLLPTAEVEQVVRARVRREAGDFAGLVDTWDAINETVLMPEFGNEPDGVPNAISRLAREIGRVGIVRLAFESAREANPAARLLINDFDLTPRYEELITELLEAGVPLEAIGLQTHMHQGFRGEEELTEVADRFAQFGLPLHFTETSLVSGDLMPADVVDLNDHVVPKWPSTEEGEARQAEEIERHYRTLVGHPAVAAITYWGLTDRGAWLGAPTGLLRADGSRKPAYDALDGLIRGEWWLPPTTLRTDAQGRVRVTGFHGDYRVWTGSASVNFTITRTPAQVELTPHRMR